MSDTPFHPAWWLPGAHAQTLFAALWRTPPRRLTLRRECWELPDGDFLDLRWTPAPAASPPADPASDTTPIVLILHGLEGSYRSPYVGHLMHACLDRGWRALLIHFRGCGDEINRLPASYHSGHTGDLAHVIARLRRDQPHRSLAAVGYSLGGNVLLKYLADHAANAQLAAAAAVSVPYDLAGAARRINRGLSRLYQWRLLRLLRRSVGRKLALHPHAIALTPRQLRRLRTFHDFDEHVTAPLHGFAGAEDYYSRCSSGPLLRCIRTPTLLIHARNDPLITPDALPDTDTLPPEVLLELSDDGGHVGFVSGGLPWSPRFHLPQRIPSFLAQHLTPITPHH